MIQGALEGEFGKCSPHVVASAPNVPYNVEATTVWALHPHQVLYQSAHVLLFQVERQIRSPAGADLVEPTHRVGVGREIGRSGAKLDRCATQQYGRL